MPELTTVLEAAKALLASLNDDNARHGGLLSRDTTRKGDELRLAISRFEKTKGA